MISKNMLKGCPFGLTNFILSLVVMFSSGDKIFIVQQWHSSQRLTVRDVAFLKRWRSLQVSSGNLNFLHGLDTCLNDFQKIFGPIILFDSRVIAFLRLLRRRFKRYAPYWA